MLPDGEHVEELRVIGDISKLLLGSDGIGNDIVTGDEQLSARGRNNSRQCAERGRLARAVGTDEPKDVAGVNLEVQPGDGDELAVGLVIVDDLNQSFHANMLLVAKRRSDCNVVRYCGLFITQSVCSRDTRRRRGQYRRRKG